MDKFIDAGNLEVEVNVIDRLIRIELDDFDRSQRFQIEFVDCMHVELLFSKIIEWDESDLSNLTQGIIESSPAYGGLFAFRVMFADDSVLHVECNSVVQKAISGFGAAGRLPSTD